MTKIDYAMLSHEQLINQYEAGSAMLWQVVASATPKQLQERIGPGKWCIQEVLCHIADFEIINAERIRRVLSENEPTLFNGEPHDFEMALSYDRRDSQEELTLIGAIRCQTGRILRCQSDVAWQRRGLHSTDGPLTLRQLVERVTSHIPHHLDFIEGKLKALQSQNSRGPGGG